ncbi:MAG: hypothetical protein LBT59_18115 [Clostridiales bacterium]|jgi:hypothetical protein|nr:hypothetical protein [Clostridiales bacterium]
MGDFTEEESMGQTLEEILVSKALDARNHEIAFALVKEGLKNYCLISRCTGLSLKEVMDIRAAAWLKNAKIDAKSSGGMTLEEARANSDIDYVLKSAVNKYKVSFAKKFGLGNMGLGRSLRTDFPRRYADTVISGSYYFLLDENGAETKGVCQIEINLHANIDNMFRIRIDEFDFSTFYGCFDKDEYEYDDDDEDEDDEDEYEDEDEDDDEDEYDAFASEKWMVAKTIVITTEMEENSLGFDADYNWYHPQIFNTSEHNASDMLSEARKAISDGGEINEFDLLLAPLCKDERNPDEVLKETCALVLASGKDEEWKGEMLNFLSVIGNTAK